MSAALSAPLVALAPAKLNLGLCVGPLTEDGRHELVTVIQAISLADELTLERAGGALKRRGTRARVPPVFNQDNVPDEVVCPGVAGPPSENLAARALAAFRTRTGWDAPPLRLTVVKHVPIAAGLGGGSADAAATLRLAASAAGYEGPEAISLLLALAAELGSDVPALVSPGRWLVTGTGERVERLADPSPKPGVLVLPAAGSLSTADVYRQADALAPPRSRADLRAQWEAQRAAGAEGVPVPPPAMLANDLQAAARALYPAIDVALTQARDSGADVALVSGSGPTVVGLFGGADGPERAQAAAALLRGRVPAPVAATTVTGDFGAPAPQRSA